jgi:hypothetical protein
VAIGGISPEISAFIVRLVFLPVFSPGQQVFVTLPLCRLLL